MTTQITVKPLRKTFEVPDEVRRFPKGRVEYINLEDTTLARMTLEPGWKWSTDVKPIAQTESCQVPHVQYVVSGRLVIAMDDGETLEARPGDTIMIPAGHDAWVLGNEPYVAIDITGMANYAKQS